MILLAVLVGAVCALTGVAVGSFVARQRSSVVWPPAPRHRAE